MEKDSTNLVREATIQMDKTIADVMPASWEGHARLAIRNSEDVPESVEDKAISKALGLSEDNDVAPKKAATKLISALKEQQS